MADQPGAWCSLEVIPNFITQADQPVARCAA